MSAMIPEDELIPVFDGEIGGELQPCVDGRTLHRWLKNGDRFADWIKKRIKTYGFIENVDFACLSVKTETQTLTGRKGNTVRKDYIVTLDVAKELSMVENNEQGRLARRYFIDCEKLLRKTVFSLMKQFNKATLEFERFCEIASGAGWTLSVVGKQYKPQARQLMEELKKKIQPMLPNLDDQNDKPRQ